MGRGLAVRVHSGPEQREHRGRRSAWPAHSAPGAGAHWWGRRGRAGQGEAGGWLTEAEPTAERRRNGAGDPDGGGFAEVAVQALGRRGK
jgi:hypothetical protein